MSAEMSAATVRQKDKSNQPVEVGDAVEVQRVDDEKNAIPGLVIDVDEHHPALNRLVIRVKGQETLLNTERERVTPLTGTEAKRTKSILGGDD